MAKVIEAVQKPTLVMAPNKTLAAQLASELRTSCPDNAVVYFVSYYDYYQPEAYVPTTDTFIEKDSSINEEVEKLRHAATAALLSRRDVVVVASVSCIYGIGSPEDYAGMAAFLDIAKGYDRDQLLRDLIEIQYDRNDFDLDRGTFRVRGDVVDIFPPYADHPCASSSSATTSRRSDAVDAVRRGDHDDVAPGEQGRRRGMTQLLDLFVDRGVLLDEGVGRRDVGLWLVVVVVADEIDDRVVGHELTQL